MISHAIYVCDNCGEEFEVEPSSVPASISEDHEDLKRQDLVEGLTMILEQTGLHLCSDPCRVFMLSAINGDLIQGVQDAVRNVLRSGHVAMQTAADRAAALQLPDPAAAEALIGARPVVAPVPTEEHCQRIHRSDVMHGVERREVAAAKSDPPCTPLGDTVPVRHFPQEATPAPRPNQPEPADAETPF